MTTLDQLTQIKNDILSGKRQDYRQCSLEAEALFSTFKTSLTELPPTAMVIPVNARIVTMVSDTESAVQSIRHICKELQQ